MLGLFGTLNMAARSLQTQQAGVEVSGQNLANVNTPGYSRQRVDIQTSPDLQTGIGSEGTGANAVSIQQIVSAVLNTQIQNQSSTGGYWNGQQTALQNAQNALGEFLNGGTSASSSTTSTTSSSSTGLATQLSGLFAAFQSVATSPASVSARQALIGQAQSLAATFNQVGTQLNAQQASLNSSLTDGVGSANTLLTSIASLNKQISSAEFSGGTANDLRDAREQDLENLASLTNITTSTGTNGSVDVSIGGQSLVAGNQVMDTLATYDPGSGNLLVKTATGGVPLTLTGGSLQGTIDARDGTLATLQNSVNTLASTLISQVNTVHSAGYSLTGSTGANFFSGSDAATIAVNQPLVDNPSLIQASSSPTATGDNTVALALAQLATASQSTLNNQTFGDSYTQTVANLGNALNDANNQVTSQTAVATMFSTQRSSISGVNTDEEMTNLMSYQQAYSASAELVTTVNAMLVTLLAMKTT
jgi:flagellar hook-associated protein 1 FlgK